MAFKMKGSPMYRNFGIGKSPAKAQGAFITDIDELTGEKTEKRATYADTRKAEKEGKDVKYTLKESDKRRKESILAAERKAAKESYTSKEDDDALTRDKKSLKESKAFDKANETPEEIEKKKSDTAAQRVIEGKKLNEEQTAQVAKDKKANKDTSKQELDLEGGEGRAATVSQEKSPAKCPLLALAGPIMGMLGKKKE